MQQNSIGKARKASECLAEMDQNQLNNLIRWNSNKLYINVYIKFYYKQYCKKIFNSKFLYGTTYSFDLISWQNTPMQQGFY